MKDKILILQVNKEKHLLIEKMLKHISSNNEDIAWFSRS